LGRAGSTTLRAAFLDKMVGITTPVPF
jgi:hypothetical protein